MRGSPLRWRVLPAPAAGFFEEMKMSDDIKDNRGAMANAVRILLDLPEHIQYEAVARIVAICALKSDSALGSFTLTIKRGGEDVATCVAWGMLDHAEMLEEMVNAAVDKEGE
jgi:hypothetical protein